MRKAAGLALWLACASIALAQAVPQITSVEPASAKAGDIVTATGKALDKGSVARVYFTDGKNDILAELVEQAAESLKVKIPMSLKPGRYGLMIEAAKNKQQIDQPVKVTVE